MNFQQCDKCKLMLPSHRLLPVIVTLKNGQRKRAYLCETCKIKIKTNFRKPNDK